MSARRQIPLVVTCQHCGKETQVSASVVAQSLGRRGGTLGGPARAAAMTPKARSETARKAALARWAK